LYYEKFHNFTSLLIFYGFQNKFLCESDFRKEIYKSLWLTYMLISANEWLIKYLYDQRSCYDVSAKPTIYRMVNLLHSGDLNSFDKVVVGSFQLLFYLIWHISYYVYVQKLI